MIFCDKDKQLIDEGTTCVSNKFIINHLPDAPDIRSAVYLLGLALSESSGTDNSCETIAQKLGITPEDVMSAYQYWDEVGLVHIVSDEPPRVIYLSPQDSASALKKIKPSKYARFSRELQTILQGRMITVNEYNEFYLFLESTTFEQDALLAVAKYCAELKGNNIGYRYILTVARNLLTKGITTLAAVADSLDCQQKYDDDLKAVFKALGSGRHFEHSDRECYEKWTKDMGFTADVIVNVAKRCKSGGMSKLDKLLCEYYRKGAMSVKEMQSYDEEKTRLYELAREINKSIGVYYQSLDMIVEEYVVNWIRKGYDDETLIAVAKYCFRSGIRTLAGVASVIDKLYKNGITTLTALDQYLDSLAAEEEKISRLLSNAGLDRRVTSSDRTLYRIWTENWAVPKELLDYAAEKSAGSTNPMSYINKLLADCKQKGIKTVEAAEKQRLTPQNTPSKTLIGGRDMQRRHYTDEQLSTLFSALDESEDL